MPHFTDIKDEKERVERAQALISEADTTYHSQRIDPEEWKKFYLGDNHWDGIKPEGDLKVVIPLPSVMLDQHVFLFTNKPPKIGLKPPSSSPFDRVKAQIGEDVINAGLYDSSFPKMFQESTMTFAQMGDVYIYLWVDAQDKRRSPKGTVKMTYLTPTTTRIVHGNGFRFHPTAVAFWERLRPEEVEKTYGKTGLMIDKNYDWVKTLNVSITEDDKITVFTIIDDMGWMVFAGGQELAYKVHNWGFLPVYQIRQTFVPDSVGSLPLLFNTDGIQKQLNLLFSAALELSLDLAYPPLLEYNNALGGMKIPKWRRQKIKVRKSDKGESLQYLAPAANPTMLLEEIRQLIDLTYITMQLPPSALGMARSQVTSGFQAQVYMQPATAKEMSWGVQWTACLQDMLPKMLKIIRKENPSAFEVEMENGKKTILEGIENYDVIVNYPEITPIDEVRKTQTMILRLQNNLISAYQALEELGDDNPFDTLDIMKQEANDPELSPQKSVAVAQAKSALKQFAQQTMSGIQELGGQVQGLTPEMQARMAQAKGGGGEGEEMQMMANMQNQTNALRGLGGQMPEQQRQVPPGARERLAPSSLGTGNLPLPIG